MARQTIKGITIEIGGDTTKLHDALKGTERDLKSNQAALKDVNKLLKLDPGNVELLTQKQRLLTDSIKGTNDKLSILKEAAKQAGEELKNGNEKQRAQYEALQREIIDTEQQLSSLTRQMQDFGSVSAQQLAAAGQKVTEFGDKVSKLGTGMTQYVTAPIVAVGAASVKAFNDVDDGMDIIIKKTGATGDALEDLKQRAKNLATSIPTDYTTAGEAVGEVNTRFGLTGQKLEDLSGKFIKFAALNDTSVTGSIDNVQSAMAAMDVSIESAGDFLDILNKAGQDTGASVDKLTGDLVSNATVLREMGFHYNTGVGFLANLSKNGVDASGVLTGLKTALKNATKDGKSMSQAMAELMGRIKGAESETKAMQIAAELFGSKAGPAMAKAIRDGRLSFDEYTSVVWDAAGSIENTFAATIDPIDECKTALNELKLVGADLVTSAAPMIKSVLTTVKDTITGVREAWEGLSPASQEAIVQAAGIAAAIGPALVVGGKLISGVGTLMTLGPKLISVFSGVKTAFAAVSAVMAANPVGAVIGIIAALILALMTLYNKCEWFREGWDNAMRAVAQGAVNAVQWIINAIRSIGSWFGNLRDSALKWGADLIENFVNGIKSMIDKPIEAVKSLAGRIRSFLGFSEPDEGPLSDFHTFAPDMMKLFAQGIRDNERLVADQLNRSLDFNPRFPTPDPGAPGMPASPQGTAAPSAPAANRPINVIFELNGVQRWIYKLNKAEEQRVGLKLT